MNSSENQVASSPLSVTAGFGACETCEHWRPEPRHKLWGRCGRVDHAMQYGAITEYPYDQKNDLLRVRLSQFDNRGRISTYRDFGCNRYSPNTGSQRTRPAVSENHNAEAPTTEPRPGSL